MALVATNGKCRFFFLNLNLLTENHFRSTDVEGVVALEPIFTDYDNLCGNRLEFRILKNNGKENISFKIKAENIDASSGYDNTEFPPVIEYTIHVRPLAKLEVLGLKTELTAGSDPVPFGVAGYDAEENEFDTLDGLQIGWYIGSKRDIAEFENYRQMGPIVKVKAIGAGKGAVIAVVSDPNYEVIVVRHTKNFTRSLRSLVGFQTK